MRTYVVGDVQGCHTQLTRLLEDARFKPETDRLWFVGDLVNRGPESLATLRFAKAMGSHAVVVLGNHDLHLLAVHYGIRKPKAKERVEEILEAPDREELMEWLRRRPLMHRDPVAEITMVHAGIAPEWSLEDARAYAGEVEEALSGPDPTRFLEGMYGDEPATWDEGLQGMERLRTITNYLTRMRICDAQGRLDLAYKLGLDGIPDGYYPWFSVPGRRTAGQRIIFGHWAALQGQSGRSDTVALDTGCVWGHSMTLLRLNDWRFFRCPCTELAQPPGNGNSDR